MCGVLTLVAEYPVVGGSSRAQRGGVRDEEEVVATATQTRWLTRRPSYNTTGAATGAGAIPRCGCYGAGEDLIPAPSLFVCVLKMLTWGV